MFLSFLPGLSPIELAPELVLFLFLPPLIYASTWGRSWREFHANLRPILLLAIGLVLVTTALVAVVAHAVVGLSWGMAFVLGAIVSPTDAVAASATAQRVGLARRIVAVLQGESIVNDATGLWSIALPSPRSLAVCSHLETPAFNLLWSVLVACCLAS